MRRNMRKIIELLPMGHKTGSTWRRNPSTRYGTKGYRLLSGERDRRNIYPTNLHKSRSDTLGNLGFNIAALFCTSKHSLPEDKCKKAACGPLAWIRVRLNRGPKMRSEPRAVRDIAATRIAPRMTQGYKY